MNPTGIEWAEAVWNPVTGCTQISDGCRHCYAERMATTRLRGRAGYPEVDPFQITLHEDRLDDPRRSKKPRRIFVCSMGDLLHEGVPRHYLERIVKTIDDTPQHTYMILTKRPERLGEIYGRWGAFAEPTNIWLGVTVEAQKYEHRIWELLRYPAAVKFISAEPMLEPIQIEAFMHPAIGINWVICGCESGPGARPMKHAWARDLACQTTRAGVPFFYKQGPGEDGRITKMPRIAGLTFAMLPTPRERGIPTC